MLSCRDEFTLIGSPESSKYTCSTAGSKDPGDLRQVRSDRSIVIKYLRSVKITDFRLLNF